MRISGSARSETMGTDSPSGAVRTRSTESPDSSEPPDATPSVSAESPDAAPSASALSAAIYSTPV
jgi:hypothetical protein